CFATWTCGSCWRRRNSRSTTSVDSSSGQFRRDTCDAGEASGQPFPEERGVERVQSVLFDGSKPRRRRPDKPSHAGHRFVIGHPRAIKRAPTPIASEVAGDASPTKHLDEAPKGGWYPEQLQRDGLENHTGGGDVEGGFG